MRLSRVTVLVLALGASAPKVLGDPPVANKDPGVFAVQSYGAVADGKTDDTTAIQRAIQGNNGADGVHVIDETGGKAIIVNNESPGPTSRPAQHERAP